MGLFPDWCRVDAAGQLSPAPGRETHFGWEAVRLPWRLALDQLVVRRTPGGPNSGTKILAVF